MGGRSPPRKWEVWGGAGAPPMRGCGCVWLRRYLTEQVSRKFKSEACTNRSVGSLHKQEGHGGQTSSRKSGIILRRFLAHLFKMFPIPKHQIWGFLLLLVIQAIPRNQWGGWRPTYWGGCGVAEPPHVNGGARGRPPRICLYMLHIFSYIFHSNLLTKCVVQHI